MLVNDRKGLIKAAALVLAIWLSGLVPAIGAAEEANFESINDVGQLILSWFSVPKEEKRGMDAVNQLRELGFDVNEHTLEEITAREVEAFRSLADGQQLDDEMQRMIESAIQQTKISIQNANVYDLLMLLGMGSLDYKTGEWTPSSNQVYAFDAEVMFIDSMYTQFLQGVQSIVGDIQITGIQEDISGITDELMVDDGVYSIPTDGKRSVSFLCNGHPYSIELESYGDWINMEIFDFMNQVLEKEGCQKRLHILTDEYDQMIIMIYGTGEQVEELRPYVDVHW